MADHQEMIHPAAAATNATGQGHGGDWWSSPDQLPGFSASWSAAASHVDGNNRSRSGNAASSESPGSNSLATGGSSITFQQDPAGVVAVSQPVPGLAAGWSQPYYLDGSGFHGYMSSRGDPGHIRLTSPSSNNNLMLQDHHDQNQQFLSNVGLELLSSPTSPSGGFRYSSLLRSLTEPSAAAKPSPGFQQYQQQTMNQAPGSVREALHFTNSIPFWNPSTGFAAAEGAASFGTSGPPSGQSRPPASLTAKSALEGAGDSSSIIAKKANTDPTPLKKARTGTPSPLPTFKVRKEKLGDRITALQQLVSPFGKTDTASVLHETIEYIKFLHEQVGSLSAPYLKNRQQVPHLKVSKDGGEAAAAKGDLTGRGLCLVPISSTFAVASETPVDFWTPFGGVFGR
ncbi:transcription factor bHLH112-like isoform X2 [Phragmites australis]|uniref:transcription factor bHLH112-like isoform X2 n=1 Tax=Phragmites australis TaxID=29695 RepID=UPI002D78897E|nr:transcription factor bHLH112-like isoform X2 [Phragmites australis]